MTHRIYLGVTVQNTSLGRQAQTTQPIRTLVQHQTILRMQEAAQSEKLDFWQMKFLTVYLQGFRIAFLAGT